MNPFAVRRVALEVFMDVAVVYLIWGMKAFHVLDNWGIKTLSWRK